MSMQSEGKDAKGRNYHQVTDGSTSAASMGAGATGEVGTIPGTGNAEGNRQAGQQDDRQGEAGRTDDLLAGGSSADQSDKGFQGQSGQQGSQSAAGTGNRQADRSTDKR